MLVGCSDRLERMHLATICAIQISASPVSVAYLRRICFSVSAVLGAPSALEALCDNVMLYKLTLTVVDKQKDKTINK